MEYDVIVAGGGAAGLAAGLVLARSLRRVVVIDSGEPRNAPSAHLHSFLSRDGMSPTEFLKTGRDEIARYDGQLLDARVQAIERSGHGFVVDLGGGQSLTTRNVLVATGLRDELPEIPGLRERWGHDVLHCPYCHGYEVRDAAIAVLGGDNRPFTLHQAQLVRQWSSDVVFFPRQIVLTGDERERLTARGVRIVDGEVARLVAGDNGLSSVEMADGTVVPRAVAFTGPQFVPQDDLLTSLGCETGDNGWVISDAAGRTSIPGVWAAGNVVDNPAQLINAASAGTTTAIHINHFLLAEDVEQALAQHRAGLG